MTTEPLGDITPPQQHRRVAVVPVALVVLIAALAVGFAVVVIMLAQAAPPAPPPAVAPVTTPSAAPLQSPIDASPDTGSTAGPNECLDPAGDAAAPDLASVALAVDDRRLRVVFVLDGSLPKGDSELAVHAENSDGVVYELVSRWKNGKLNALHAIRLDGEESESGEDDDSRGSGSRGGDGRTDSLDRTQVTVTDGLIVAYFPHDILEQLGTSFQWNAYSLTDDATIDSCPGGSAPDGLLHFVG